MRDLNKFIGVFGEEDKIVPLHDLAGDGPCIVCGKPLNLPGKIPMQVGLTRKNDRHSYFIRPHKACWAKLNDAERQEIVDSFEKGPFDLERDINVPHVEEA